MTAAIRRNQRQELEIWFVDRLLETWAFWSRHGGVDLRPVPAGRVLGIKFEIEGRYHFGLNDDELLLVDQGIARLPSRLKTVVETEYFRSAPAEQKARSLGLAKLAYRQRLYAAQWGTFVALNPHVTGWMARFA